MLRKLYFSYLSYVGCLVHVNTGGVCANPQLHGEWNAVDTSRLS
jgi:hypothetical protein